MLRCTRSDTTSPLKRTANPGTSTPLKRFRQSSNPLLFLLFAGRGGEGALIRDTMEVAKMEDNGPMKAEGRGEGGGEGRQPETHAGQTLGQG